MLLQIQKNWVSSTLGNHILLAMFKNNYVHTNYKYVQIENYLKKKTGYKNETKVFCSDINDVKEQLKCNVEMATLANFQESIRKISSWANKKIIDELKEIFKTLDTKFILTNLSTFKGKWNKSDSEGAVMKVYNSFSYTEDIKYEARLLELPLQDNDFKLVIIVPNGRDVLRNLYNKLSVEGLTVATDSIQPLFTYACTLRAPNIKFNSELEVTQQFLSNDLCLTTAEFGNVLIDDQGVSINVLTCISPTNRAEIEQSHAKHDISKNPFYFNLVFKDMTILTGQYINVNK